MKKGKIGLVAMFTKNYGNHLVNMALFHVLKSLGYPVTIIFCPGDEEEAYRKESDLFLKSPYSEKDMIWPANRRELIDTGTKYDIYIVGGDQQFISHYVDGMEYFSCLYWVSERGFKMSYGTSFGADCFEPYSFEIQDMIQKMQYLFKRFQFISVRESAGVDLLKRVFSVSGMKVVDPVFLCEPSFYHNLSEMGKERICRDSYVGAYILDVTRQKEELVYQAALSVCNGNSMVITDAASEEINFEMKELHVLTDVKIEEWLSIIEHSSFFITDSFHGVCMAIMMQKQFCFIEHLEPNRGMIRITELLENFGLSDRLVPDYETFQRKKILEKKIDYTPIFQKLEERKEKSLSWLREKIALAADYHVQESVFDRYLRSDIKCGFAKLYENDTFVAWGAGDCLKRNQNILKGYISWVCDKNPAKWNQQICPQMVCISPIRLKDMKHIVVIITIDSRETSAAVIEELISMEIKRFTHVTSFIKLLEQGKNICET